MMTKRHRLEDLGKLSKMLEDIIEHEIFEHTGSKHAYDDWVKQNHDKLEYENEPRGLDYIFRTIRGLKMRLEECYVLAEGDDE